MWEAIFDPPEEEKERLLLLAGTTVWKKMHCDNQYRAMSAKPLADIVAELDKIEFEGGGTIDAAMTELSLLLSQSPLRQNDPMAFGIFSPAPAFPAVLGDLIASALNLQLSAWSAAPVANAIERRIIQWFGHRFGFPEGSTFGHFTSGGGEANTTGLLVALATKYPLVMKEGLASLQTRPLLYCSAAGHPSWTKAAKSAGIGESAVRWVSTYETGEIDTAVLREMIRADRANGGSPFMIVGTAGTTTAGAIDHLTDLAQIAKEENLYFHVDAAWGGAICLSDTYRCFLRGIELADAITFDPHKWLSLPFATGMFITRHMESLVSAFGSHIDYFASNIEYGDPHATSAQWSRRFNGAKLFMMLRTVGRSGFGEMVDHQVELGSILRDRLIANEWQVENKTVLPVVCFTDPHGGVPSKICAHVVSNNAAFITTPNYNGKPVLRAGIIKYTTKEKHVDELIALLQVARRSVAK